MRKYVCMHCGNECQHPPEREIIIRPTFKPETVEEARELLNCYGRFYPNKKKHIEYVRADSMKAFDRIGKALKDCPGATYKELRMLTGESDYLIIKYKKLVREGKLAN